MTDITGDAKAIIDALEERQQIKLVDLESNVGDVSVLVTPQGTSVQSTKKFFDEYLDAPRRKKGTATFTDLDSFIGHANRFKNEASALFANQSETSPSITSVLDYHEAAAGSPRFGEHRGHYACPLSEEWLAWGKQDGEAMGQAAFAEFIEDRILDIADPATITGRAKEALESLGSTYAPPSKLFELSRGLSVKVDQNVSAVVKLASGETSIQFAEAHKDENGAPLKVPGAFAIAIPVFKNGPIYGISVRLRYRASNARISWYFEMHRADRVFDDAFKEACAKSATDTALPLFFGTPE